MARRKDRLGQQLAGALALLSYDRFGLAPDRDREVEYYRLALRAGCMAGR
jgi:hypothetical protein